MLRKLSSYWILTLCVIGSFVPVMAAAQALRYIDEAGNIRFVEDLKQVPRKYREQIVPPTPTPVLDRQALQQKKRLEMEAMRRKELEERRKIREEMKREAVDRKRQEKENRRLKEQEQAGGFSKGSF